MEDKKKVVPKRLKLIFTILILIFACLYLSKETGYYERKISNNTLLTKERIKEFEKDVAEGKQVDIKDYIMTKKSDYKNPFSKLGMTISNIISKILNDGVSYVIKFLNALFS